MQSLGAPSQAFARLSRSGAALLICGCLICQAFAIHAVFAVRPAFLLAKLETAMRRQSTGATNDTVAAGLKRYELRTVEKRIRTELIYTLLLTLWWDAMGLLLWSRRIARRLAGAAAAFLAAFVYWFAFLSPSTSPWIETLSLLVLAGVGGVAASRCGAVTLDVFRAVAVAGCATTCGFVSVLGASVLMSADIGSFTLAGVAPAHTVSAGWFGRIDIIALWWCASASTGLSTVWKRSYVVTVIMVSALTTAWMLFAG